MSNKSAAGLSIALVAIGLILLAGGVVAAVVLARSAGEQATGSRDLPRVRVDPGADTAPGEPPSFASDEKGPTESDLVWSRRLAARRRYLQWTKDEQLGQAKEARLRIFLHDYQRRFFAARVANITGTSDAGTAEEQIRGYQRLDAEALQTLRHLLGEARTKSFLARFKHPRALIVHRFLAD